MTSLMGLEEFVSMENAKLWVVMDSLVPMFKKTTAEFVAEMAQIVTLSLENSRIRYLFYVVNYYT